MKTKLPMNLPNILFALFAFLSVSIAQGQNLNNTWKKSLDESLKQFLDCEGNGSSTTPCSNYVGETVNTVYQVNDFYSQKLGRYMMVNETAQYVSGNPKWKQLGKAYEQGALKEAQQYANSGKAVIAIYLNDEGIGHMALILPGELQPSGSWGLSVPNSASFLTSDAEKSYVGKGLSYAFPRNVLKDVLIYARN